MPLKDYPCLKLTYLGRPMSSFLILKMSIFCFYIKSKPVLKICFRDQIGLPTIEMQSESCVNNALPPSRSPFAAVVIAGFRQELARFPHVSAFPAIPGSYLTMPIMLPVLSISKNKKISFSIYTGCSLRYDRK